MKGFEKKERLIDLYYMISPDSKVKVFDWNDGEKLFEGYAGEMESRISICCYRVMHKSLFDGYLHIHIAV